MPPTSSPVTSDTAKGNLVEPLSRLQVFGVWPEGDFRFEPDDMLVTYVLVGSGGAGGLLGLVLAWRRRRDRGAAVRGGTAAAGAAIVAVGSPWVDAKALATASPAVVFAALVGAGLLAAGGRRVEGAWSARARLRRSAVVERARVPRGQAGAARPARGARADRRPDRRRGPALMTEYEPYGVRHFLRKADAEGASELRRRVVPLRSGRPLRKLGTADIDEFELAGIRAYRTLVLRRSPVASRPPSVYRLLSRGRFYDVWQLAPGLEDSLLEHVPLGRRGEPAARPRVRAVRALGRRAAAAGGRLAVARAPRAVRVDMAAAATRAGARRPVPGMPGAVYPGKEARFDATVSVRRPGPAPRLRRGRVPARARGLGRRPAGRDQAPPPQPRRVLRAAGRGRAGARLAQGGDPLPPRRARAGERRPGVPARPSICGGALGPARGAGAARDGRGALCGRRLDWIESVSR